MDKIRNVYYYNSIKDVIINHLDLNKIFRELTNIDPLTSSKNQIINALEANNELDAVKEILKRSDNSFLAIRDSNKYIQIIELDTPERRPLEHYKKPETLKKIRTDMGYTQEEFGYKLGYHSIRRAHTISEKEQGKLSLSGRDARILRYLSVYGELETE